MQDYLDIGASPPEEDCVQVNPNDPDYGRKQKIECEAYIQAIRKKLGNEPIGARLKVKGNPHDFGQYFEVICQYEDTEPEAIDYAFACESDGPATWEEVGMAAPIFEEKGKKDRV